MIFNPLKSTYIVESINPPETENIALFSILGLPMEEALTVSDTLSRLTPSRPESVRSSETNKEASSSSHYIKPTYEPLSDDEWYRNKRLYNVQKSQSIHLYMCKQNT